MIPGFYKLIFYLNETYNQTKLLKVKKVYVITNNFLEI